MRLLLAGTAIGLVLATVLPIDDATALCASRTRITGFWKSDDGGKYTVRLAANNVVWWLGEGPGFTNVFRGVINGNTITGEWSDVLHTGGGSGGFGTLSLQLDGTLAALNGFHKLSDTGGFGGTRWFFPCADN